MGKNPWYRICDLIFKVFWVLFSIALAGIPWFFYRINRKAYADAMNLDVGIRRTNQTR